MQRQKVDVLTHMHTHFFWLTLSESIFLTLERKNIHLLSYGRMHLIQESRLPPEGCMEDAEACVK